MDGVKKNQIWISSPKILVNWTFYTGCLYDVIYTIDLLFESHNAPLWNRNVHVLQNSASLNICLMHCRICEMGTWGLHNDIVHISFSNLNTFAIIFIPKNASENIVCKMGAIFLSLSESTFLTPKADKLAQSHPVSGLLILWAQPSIQKIRSSQSRFSYNHDKTVTRVSPQYKDRLSQVWGFQC